MSIKFYILFIHKTRITLIASNLLLIVIDFYGIAINLTEFYFFIISIVCIEIINRVYAIV
jgi:hypothetical protein